MSTAVLLGRSWNACDGGVNNAANSGFLLWLFIPCLGAVLLLVWAAAGVLLGNRPVPHALALTVTLLATAWCAFSIFWAGTATLRVPTECLSGGLASSLPRAFERALWSSVKFGQGPATTDRALPRGWLDAARGAAGIDGAS
ncbi:hypothetical protein [Streptomyces flaveolus]|uniref:hypothetical protein n=1 Tax=Streptomyces flaveolus TaxID=67297 RepID=UPI0033F3F401